jgi:hypothetical protein
MATMGKMWGSRVPPWGLPLSAKGYHALMAMVAAELKSRGATFDFGDAAVIVEAAGERSEIDLKRLVDACVGKGREEWGPQVARHLDENLRPQG